MSRQKTKRKVHTYQIVYKNEDTNKEYVDGFLYYTEKAAHNVAWRECDAGIYDDKPLNLSFRIQKLTLEEDDE